MCYPLEAPKPAALKTAAPSAGAAADTTRTAATVAWITSLLACACAAAALWAFRARRLALHQLRVAVSRLEEREREGR